MTDSDWEHHVPLQLPIDDPYRRPPTPAETNRDLPEDDPDADLDEGIAGRRVIVIDLA